MCAYGVREVRCFGVASVGRGMPKVQLVILVELVQAQLIQHNALLSKPGTTLVPEDVRRVCEHAQAMYGVWVWQLKLIWTVRVADIERSY